MTKEGIWSADHVRLQRGGTLKQARIVWKTYGTLSPKRDNVILYPTSYGAHHTDIEWLVDVRRCLDPSRYFIVIPNMLTNGLSSSPSNTPDFPEVTTYDNVMLQRQMLVELFGIDRLKLVYGWSMGAQQAYQWAVSHPERVERICCVCGTARTSPHNRLFLLSLRQALTADSHWTGSGFSGVPEQGLRTYALIYASWAASQPFFRGITEASVEQHVEERWLPAYRRHDPRDLIAMLDTWLANDVAGGDDLAAALGGISARTAVVACSRDLYFTVEDMAAEAAAIPGARWHVLDSLLGHRAGNPHSSPAEQRQLRRIVDQLLSG